MHWLIYTFTPLFGKYFDSCSGEFRMDALWYDLKACFLKTTFFLKNGKIMTIAEKLPIGYKWNHYSLCLVHVYHFS